MTVSNIKNMKKIIVGIIFGGKSAEHEVSLRSAKNVIEAIDTDKYEPVLIGIDKNGKWFLTDSSEFPFSNEACNITLVPQSNGKIVNLDNPVSDLSIDVVFPILHGPYGEDGTMQGLLKLANVPFVGAGVLGSAIGMDKDVMKRLLRDAGIPIGKFLTFKEQDMPNYEEIVKNLGLPFFVKPANMGSSVGVSKVSEKKDFDKAIQVAFKYDRKILIEENIIGREIECSVLGNDHPIASIPGEIISGHDYYSYEAKYIDEHGAILEIPAKLSDELVNKVQALAIKTFKTLSCEGLGRVDFFLNEDGDVLVNEINTIPGFTSVSMYPKLWEASGVSYTELIDRLIQLALERFEQEQKLNTFYETD
ncbi:MAG: D-alanine-D-alanine ligase [Candidatus Berkelbacteria bacterium Gr01-1014_85]|uniref:D-alanine--D-alanine ligase n=1 Tax=Candidatus Berkelbacteria bacterium Gr01-1014_85 TaxID=2017150 RepID=A0A554JC84_9BACT|nr:MAG: D-alanine-D-alanine ligase [Candidatus Berkelbacteria bacterium Gr01-1014_85]